MIAKAALFLAVASNTHPCVFAHSCLKASLSWRRAALISLLLGYRAVSAGRGATGLRFADGSTSKPGRAARNPSAKDNAEQT